MGSDEFPRYSWHSILEKVRSSQRSELLEAIEGARRHLVAFIEDHGVRVDRGRLPSTIQSLRAAHTIDDRACTELIKAVLVRNRFVHGASDPTIAEVRSAVEIICDVCVRFSAAKGAVPGTAFADQDLADVIAISLRAGLHESPRRPLLLSGVPDEHRGKLPHHIDPEGQMWSDLIHLWSTSAPDCLQIWLRNAVLLLDRRSPDANALNILADRAASAPRLALRPWAVLDPYADLDREAAQRAAKSAGGDERRDGDSDAVCCLCRKSEDDDLGEILTYYFGSAHATCGASIEMGYQDREDDNWD